MVDFKKRIIDLEAGWPGSVGDARIWNRSNLNRMHKTWLVQLPSSSLTTGASLHGEPTDEDIPPFILGDSAYPNTRHMVTTYKATEMANNAAIAALNKKLGGARYHVENAFGILKQRFQILKRPLECSGEDVRYAIRLIVSIFVLHNFLIDVRDELNNEFEHGDEDVQLQHDGEVNNEVEVGLPATHDVLLRHIRFISEF